MSLDGGGSSTNTTQNYSPEEAAERTKVAQEVRTQYDASKAAIAGQGYAGAVPITPSAATTQGQNIAMGAIPQLQNMAQGVAQAQQFGLSDVLNPASNPGLQGYIDSAIRPITESYVDPGGVMSQIRTGANEAGQVGSSRQGVAEGIAAGRYANAVGDTTAKIVNDAYGQGLDTFGKTLALAPQTMSAQTQPADVASAVGSQQEQYQNLLNQYEAASRDWDLNKNWDLLQNYANMVYGAGGSQSTSTQNTNPSALQTAGNVASTGLGLYGLAKMAGLFATSDPSLKQDVKRVGQDERTGLGIYEFAYKSAPDFRFRGVMADEVQEKYPSAVVKNSDGYLMVDYGKLGLKMEAVHA
jgi:hypothetical protein